jgi:S-(hydroxymethyl)glutathione dehydrogenase/alcohol dehydrogenase
VGSAKAIEQGMGLLRQAGTLVVVGMPPAGVKAELEALDLADYSYRILGSKMGATRLAVDIPKLVAHYQQGRLKLDQLISARYPLDQINQAIADVSRPETLRNVIVF